jgi:hypothetical protein
LKVTHLIPPAIALVAVCVWNMSELRNRSAMDQQISALQGEVGTASTTTAATTSADAGNFSSRPRPAQASVQIAPTTAVAEINWKTIPGLMDDSLPDNMARMLALAEFHQKLGTISRTELVTALDNLDSFELSPEVRRKLESAILDPLIVKDPEYALSRFADRIDSDPDGIGRQLAAALREWVKKDPTAASDWLDRQIAEGKFLSKTLDGKSEILGRYEAFLMESLMSEDPAAAARRLAGVPEDQRLESLQQLSFEDLGEPEQQVYIDLVRRLVPEAERQGTFAHIGEQLVFSGGYDKVSAFLDASKATPTERAAAAAQAVNSRLSYSAQIQDISPQDLAEIESWLGTQAPQSVGKIIGKALAEAAQIGGKLSYEDASKFILIDQKTHGTDDGLVAFLKSYSASSNLEQAADLIERVSDPAQREIFRQSLK